MPGAAYVVFSLAGGFADVDFGTGAGAAGFRIVGASPGDWAGNSLSSPGNGAGFDDIVVGAEREPNQSVGLT